MARPPTKHGLERKYKSWRRGKSDNPSATDKLTKAGSLKNQLRSQKRFLAKLGDKDGDEEGTKATREKIEVKIRQIEEAISDRNKGEREKKIAARYHQIKFFERQKLTRLEKKVKKRLDEAKAAADFDDVKKYTEELEQTCLDQLYVAYYPNDKKYMALFSDGKRAIDSEQESIERDQILDGILKKLKNGEIDKSKSWVNLALIKAKDFRIERSRKRPRDSETRKESAQMAPVKIAKRKVNSSIKEETETLRPTQAGNISNGNEAPNDNKKKTDVNRGKKNKIEKKSAGKARDDSDSSSTNDSDSSSDDEVDVMDTFEKKKNTSGGDPDVLEQSKSEDGIIPTVGDSESSDSSSSDSSDSDSDSESDATDSESNIKKPVQSMPTQTKEKQMEGESEAESEDDFLVDVNEGNEKDIFTNASKLSVVDENKGNKSKGWATQKQRPGEWKRKTKRSN